MYPSGNLCSFNFSNTYRVNKQNTQLVIHNYQNYKSTYTSIAIKHDSDQIRFLQNL